MGYNGKECILRALCESSKFFPKKKNKLVEELLKSVFSLPKPRVLSFEHKDLFIYDKAYKSGCRPNDCKSLYPDCSFSLLELGLGRYSKPTSHFM